LLDSLGKLADNLITLRVTTAIGAVTASNITEVDEKTTIGFQVEAKEVASTSINMLLGDCNTVLSQGFADNQSYAQIHNAAVATARAVRTDTIDMIGKGIEAVRAMGKA
jgi:hypothetical protein